MFSKENKISIVRMSLTLLMLMLVVVGGTYAWLTFSSKQSAMVLTIGTINDTQIQLSPYQVEGSIAPGTTYSSGVFSDVAISKGNSNSTTFALFYKINNIDTTLIDKGLAYTIVNTANNSTVKTGYFSDLIDTSKPLPSEVIILDTNTDVTLSNASTANYKVYVWVDSTKGKQNEIQDTTLDIELNASIGSTKIAGYSVYGHTLTAEVNDTVIDTTTTYSYQWYSNTTNSTKGGTAISGATSSSYTVGKGLVGKYIYVVVTTSKGKTLSDITDSSNNYVIDQECDNFNDGRIEKTTPVLTLEPAAGSVEAGSDQTVKTTVAQSQYYKGEKYTGTQTAVSSSTNNITIKNNATVSMSNIGSATSTITYHGQETNAATSSLTITFAPSDTANVCSVAKTYTIEKKDTTAPVKPTITLSDCDTFTYTSSDTVGVTGYYISTSSTKPSASATGWTTSTTHNFTVPTSATTYYVWAKDNSGNISSSATTALIKITRTQGTGTTLTTKYNNGSQDVGFTNNIYTTANCTVSASAAANSGYNNVKLKFNSAEVTNPSSTTTKSALTIASEATQNTTTITLNKDGSNWSSSGMNVALYSGTTSKYAYSAATASGATVVWKGVAPGTYNIYAGKNSGSKTTLVDTGIDVTIAASTATTTSYSGSINYYTLTVQNGNTAGISAVSGGAVYLSNQTATITATIKTGYTFSNWTIASGGNTPASTTASSTTISTNKKTTATANATANTYSVAYTMNGGNAPSVTSGTYDQDVAIAKPTKTFTVNVTNSASATISANSASSSQTFAGWTSNSSSGLSTATAKYGSAASPTSSWSGSSVGGSYDATYFKNLTPTKGGTVTLTANWTAVAISLPTVTKDGYTCGYTTTSTGTTITYASKSSYTPSTTTANVTLYTVCISNKATVTINKDGSAWSSSGLNVALYSGTTPAYAYSAGTASASTVYWTGVKAGTYNIYAGKSSGDKTTLIDTGVDITVTTGTTAIVAANATINYYSLTLQKGTGISAVSNGGTNTTSAVQYLYNSSNPQEISIDATVISGYTWSKWTKESGTNLATFATATKSQKIKMGAGAAILKANAPDITKPTVSDIGGGTNDKTGTQTLTLKCTDTVGVTAYYWGTTNPTATSSITTTTAADLTALQGSSGLSKTVTAAGTYYLGCKDAAGNYATKSITIHSYTVNNLLENINGTTGNYTSKNYTSASTGTYIVKSGSTIPLAGIFTAPTGSSQFNGYSTTYSSSTAASPSTTSPTVANGTTYYMWFNRETFAVTITKPTNGTVKAETVTQTGNSKTASTSSQTLTVKYGDTVKATATAGTGYTFTGWSGGYVSGTTNPVTGAAVTANKTITGAFADQTKPVVSDIGGGTTDKTGTQTLTLKCTDTVGVTAYYWGTTNPTAASSITTTTSADLTALQGSSGLSKTVTSAGTYYLGCKDAAGNYATKSITIVSYTVNNLLETVAGTTGNYTSKNYTSASTGTYIVKSGSTIPLAGIFTAPTGSETFNGYSTTYSSSTAASPSTTSPTVSNGTTYYMWFDRKTYTVTITKPTNGTVKAETVTKTGNSKTASTSSQTLTVKYGDTVKATATPGTGYTFTGWSGGYVSGTTNPVTGATVTANKTITGAFVDQTKPTVSDIGGGTTLKSSSQTLTLKCTDGAGVTAYYWGTTNPTAASSITTTTSADITSLQGSGLSKSVTAAGTYYLGCKDAAGNYATKSITIVSYTVNNLLETVAGTTGTYTSANYTSTSTGSYIVKSGTSLTLASIYTIPTGAASGTFKGYSTGYSTSAASPSTTAPTVANGTTYYMWFNRSTFAVTITKPTNGTVKAETVTKTGNSTTASTSSKTLTVKYGDTVKATATPGTGYTFTGWSGGYVSGTTNPVTGAAVTGAKTITGTFVDQTKPVVSDIGGGTSDKTGTQTLTLKCTDTVGVTAYYWGTTNPTATSSITTTTAADLTALQGSSGLSKTVTAAGTYYLGCKDAAGNYATKSITIHSYTVNNLLENINGTAGNYTSKNYTSASSGTYIIKSGSTIPLAGIFTAPTGSETFNGYSTTYSSSTAASPSTTSPTVSNGTTYYMWFNRSTYTVTITKPTNGTVKAETVTKTGNSTTASTSSKTLTVKYGDTVKATATPGTGYTFTGWSGGYVSGTTNPVTGAAVTGAKTITGTFLDQTKPVVSDISGGTTLKSSSQTLTLKCTDTVGVTAYYWGTTNPTAASSITTTTSADLTSLQGSGLSKTVTSAGTYYLGCKDAAGNYATKSITINSYTVNNLLETIAGTTGTYTSANYTSASSGTYIIKSGSTLTLTGIFTAPTEADILKGYSTTYSSSTAASPSTTAPTVANGTTYYIWFNRKTYTVTITKPTNGTIKAETVTKTGNSKTASTSSQTLTVKYGDTVKATATPGTGYTFTGWSGGYVSGTTNPVTGATVTANKTITGAFADQTKPTVSDIGGGTTLKSSSQTLTLKCTDGAGVTAYYWGTTNPTAASSITTTTSADLTSLQGSGLSKTVTSAGTYYLGCKDATGNYATKSITIVSYGVNNLLETIAGTTGTYTSANYTSASSGTYIIKSGSTLTLTGIFTAPTEADILKGYSTTYSSSTAASPSTTAPTVANGTTYYIWFNRKTYTVTITKPTNGTIKAETVTKTGNSKTASTSSQTLTVKYGDTVKATATPGTGYTFTGWSGGYVSGTTNPVTGATVTANKTITGTFVDQTKPVVSDISGGTTLKSSSQTLTLKCTDTVGVTAYYWGTTNPTAASSITTTTAADLTALQGSSGLSKTVTAAGTYYLGCKDAAGNYATKSITIHSYTVNNLLENINGTTGTYTSANYTSASSGTYIIKSGSTLTLTGIFTAPTEADILKGYSTTYSSSTAASPSTTAPTVANGTTYYIWFNRKTYTVTITKPTNGTIKTETVTKTGNSKTASTSSQTLTVKYGDTVKATATPGTGYTFTGWSGGYVSGTTNPVTGATVTANKTITGAFADQTKPTVSDIGGGTTLKSSSQTLTLKCTDGVGVTAYYWGTTNPTAASSITTTTSADLTSLQGSGLSKTVTAAGTYYLGCKDAAGNYATKSITIVSYGVNNLLETIAGTTGTYTSANYTSASSGTYIIKSGSTLTLTGIFTAPTEADILKGYSTTYSSSTAASPSTTAPTVANGTTYYIWFNRKTYTVTITKPTNGTIKAETVTKTGNSKTASTSSQTLTVKYGDTVKATATPGTGYTFTGWSGGYVSGTTNPVTGATVTANKTITGAFADQTKPTVSDIGGGTTLKSSSQTLTLKCTDGAGVTAYYWGTTNPTAASSITTTTSADLTSLQGSGLSKTVTAAGTYYLGCKDAAGNYATKSITIVSYGVNNLLETIAGTTGTYTSANYTSASSGTYIIKSGSTLTLTGIFTAPTEADIFKGYSTTYSSSTAASPSTTSPTVANGTTYYMWFNRKTFALTLNKGTGISSVSGAGTYKYGKSVSIGAVVTTGYTFTNWTKSAGNTPASTTSTSTTVTITQATTLQANANANTYTVTYYNGTTKINTSTHTYGTAKNLTTWANLGATITNSKNGWSFAGWSTANNNTTRTYTNGQSVNNLVSTSGGNINLYAVYSRTFKFYSGIAPTSTLSSSTQYWNPYGTTNGTHLTSITIPSPTAINGWTYLGYRATNDATSSTTFTSTGTSTPASNSYTGFDFRTIYKRTLTISYNGNGSTSGSTSNTTVDQYYNSGYASSGSNSGANVSTATFTLAANGFAKKGHSFSKWADGSTSGTQYAAGNKYTWNPGVNSTATTKTMYAIWTANTYTITYNANGGSGTMNSTSFSYGSSVTIAANAFTAPKGHQFSVWSVNSNAADSNGWTGWKGTWSYDNGEYGIANNTLNLYAIWAKKNFTVSYNCGTGTGTAPSNQTIAYGSTITVASNTCSKTGYTFDRWTTNSNETNDGHGWTAGWSGAWNYDNGQYGISGDELHLYPVWTAKTYTVSYSCGTGTGTAPSNQTTTFNSTITIASNTCSKTGYTFDRWTTNSNGTNDGHGWTAGWSGTWAWDNGSYGISGNKLQLYPVWVDNTAPGTPTITPGDCDTLTVSATDGVGVTGYYVSTSSTKPSASASGWTSSTSHSFTAPTSATTYYVWAKDAAGNISASATKALVKITRSQGSGSILTTRYNSTSSSSGTAFTSNIYVAPNCSVWSSASASTGYTAALSVGGTAKTIPNTSILTAASTIASTANANTYYVKYMNGTSTLGTSTHTYGTAKNLTTWANLKGSVPSGWSSFGGWATSTSATSATHTDGKSVNNLTSTSGGTVTLYAIFTRNASFTKATRASAGPTGGVEAGASTATQSYNPAGSKYSVTTPTVESYGTWTALGWRDDTTAGTSEVSASTTYTGSSQNLYAVYKRTANFYTFDVASTDDSPSEYPMSTATQYFNINGTFSVTTPSPSKTITNQGFTILGWRDDTTSSTAETTLGGTSTSSYQTFYAVYSYKITAYSGKSKATTSTLTAYYNTGGRSALAQTATATAISGWTHIGWRDDTTASTDDGSLGTTIYAVYSRNLKFVSGKYGGTLSTITKAQYYNTNGSVSSVASPATSSMSHISSSYWTRLGWTNSSSVTNSYTAGGNNVSPGVTGSATYYGVYRRSGTQTYRYTVGNFGNTALSNAFFASSGYQYVYVYRTNVKTAFYSDYVTEYEPTLNITQNSGKVYKANSTVTLNYYTFSSATYDTQTHNWTSSAFYGYLSGLATAT